MDLSAPVYHLLDLAKKKGYEARLGVKRNAKGELVIALILPPRVDAREAKRLERAKRS